MSKVVVITGANSGIGYGAALQLAKEGYQILMICRNKDRGSKARDKIINKSGSSEVYLYLADLADFDEIVKVAEEIESDWDRIDVLINNAGIILTDKKLSEQGIELTIAVNHFGHFLLTDLLHPLLMNSQQGRIINTSSGAHRSADMNFDDINYEEHSYSIFGAYGRSKLANILFTHKLGSVLSDTPICVYSIHPGFVGTNFAKNNGVLATIVMTLLRPFAKSPHTGAQPLIYLATADDISEYSGQYFVDKSWVPFTGPKIRPKQTSHMSYDSGLEDLLWQKSIDLVRSWQQDYEFNMV